jgi:hypothetical protein
MISDCVYCGILELNETGFFLDVFALLVVVIPGAICLTLWRLFVTNKSGPRGGIVVLGLDDSSSIYSDLSQSVSIYLRLSYFLISVLTFVLGLLSSEGLKALHNLVP